MLHQLASRFLSALLLAVGLACLSGCLSTSVEWRNPDYLPPLSADQIAGCGPTARAERIYAKGVNFEARCRDACVDLYFEAACLTAAAARDDVCFCRARQLHESALMRMIVTGHRFKRFDPAQGLTIHRKGSEQLIPLSRHGFVWAAADFQELVPVGNYRASGIRVKHQRRGLGVPFVVQRGNGLNRPLMRERGVFPSTLVLRSDSDDSCSCENPQASCRLELYDPLRVDVVEIEGKKHEISKDTSASLAFALQGQEWSFLNYFIYPTARREEGQLYMLEPFQKDKIPLILIHGLLSDPFTWVEMVNELIIHPGFIDHYQIWAFEYSTGNSFLLSAAGLRDQLVTARQVYNPFANDRQYSNMILIGHSMGGLVAKLQVTCSGDRVWDSVANRPLNEINASETTRDEIQRLFFFEPSPDIDRVVFMATPHRGSSVASGPIGRLSSKLVEMPAEQTRQHDLLVRSNPGVFSDEFRDRVPTSVDMLNPHSKLLQTIADLPVANEVTLHSIVGNLCWTLMQGKSDGIVPMSSAWEPRAVSEKVVKTTHSGVKGSPESIKEVLYILQEHLMQSQGCANCPSTELAQHGSLEEQPLMRDGPPPRTDIAN